MRTIRVFVAHWVAKAAYFGLRAIGRKGSHLPGFIALKLFPGLLQVVPKPARVIVVTGTNGKTTVTNLLADTFAAEGIPAMDNREGSNTDAGVASALLLGLSWKGKPKAEVAILEMDERSARKILPGLAPQILVCTNLTRDSVKRNAHPGYIAWIIGEAVPSTTTLVLNADDLICAGIAPANPRVYFGVGRLPTDTTEPTGAALDLTTCPACDTLLVWDYWRFNHIGRAHCPTCDFTSPTADYRVRSVDFDKELLELDLPHQESHSIQMLNPSLVNIYNQIAVIAVLDQCGIPRERILAGFDHLKVPESRHNVQRIGEVTLVRQLTKGVVGVACSRAFQDIMAGRGTKALVMNIDEVTDIRADCENTCWVYDADYEFLADESLQRVVIGGVRRYDQALRLAIAGVDPGIIQTVEKERAGADLIDLDGMDRVYNMHSVHNTISTGDFVQARLIERLSKETR